MTPSFSIVVETENLESAGQQELLDALKSLARQSLSPELAREVLIVNSGRVEESVVNAIRTRFPWIAIHASAEPLDYYAAKALGVSLTSGDIVLMFDSDVQYDAHWLESVLELFGSDPDLDLVTGETSLEVSGPYTLAVLLAWAFPPLTRRAHAYATTGYAANNVAFRRRVLDAIPIPVGTGLWRGNCTLHSHRLVRARAKMLRSPQASAIHPMLPFRNFYPRLWGAGFNDTGASILAQRSLGRSNGYARVYALLYVCARRSLRVASRTFAVVSSHPRWLAYLPIALPLAITGLAASFCGAATASVSRRIQGSAPR
jgi:glycosyltransferase involved in cell wall biosynthesis